MSRSAFMPREGGASHAPSWYAATAGETPVRPPLRGARRADVAVIGAGYTGLSTALHLARAGRDVVVLEAYKVGWGASGRNGGQIHPGQRRDPDWLAARLGEGATRDLLRFADEALDYQRALVRDHAIDCDLADGLIHGIHKARYVEEEKRAVEDAWTRWGVGPVTFLDRAETAAPSIRRAGTCTRCASRSAWRGPPPRPARRSTRTPARCGSATARRRSSRRPREA
jgi:gamma-glutamylputrescine oxidase